MASSNIEKIFTAMKENPELVKELNKAIVDIFIKADAVLTYDDKKEFFIKLSEHLSMNKSDETANVGVGVTVTVT